MRPLRSPISQPGDQFLSLGSGQNLKRKGGLGELRREVLTHPTSSRLSSHPVHSSSYSRRNLRRGTQGVNGVTLPLTVPVSCITWRDRRHDPAGTWV